ncbi:fluconazole resistance protein 1 [Podospora fimiseda]|uniref:Fluconazole resistance protein 1 n=1 Tax=Podospora fimiseda TaxID=252190 RepID=A0AAN6YSC7_9PEZI|nr:fluconazole resistance protein 1 [Podospora fimiseda]
MDEKDGSQDVAPNAKSTSFAESSSSTAATTAAKQEQQETTSIRPDIDHEEAEGACPGHALDVELAQHPHDITALSQVLSRSSPSVKSKLSRALSRKKSTTKPPKDRIPFDPIPITDLDAGIIGWDSQTDPSMPLNWPKRKKWFIVGLLSVITFLTPFASSIVAPGVAKINKEFESDSEILGTFIVSIYLMGYVVGPLFLAPLSEIYGRKQVLGVANVIFCTMHVGCALAPSLMGLIVFRFLAGLGGAGCLTLGAGIIADVFRTDERGFAIGIYTLGPLIGPTVGPILGGFIAETIGWRWDFWLVLIIGSAVTILTEFVNKETNPRVLIERKIKQITKETGRIDLRSCYEKPGQEKLSRRQVIINGLVRPMKMLFLSPLVFFISLYIAFAYGTLYLLFTTIPMVFMETYGWDIGVTGLVYLSLGVGNLGGWGYVTARSDKDVVRRTKLNDGVFVPEFRLPITIWFSLFVPMTFFWYGWSTYYHTHWIVPVLGLFPFTFGIVGILLPLTTYLVDCYPMYAASAIAANTVFRSLAGVLLPLAGPPMYEELGLGWGNSLLGFLCVLMVPVPLLIYKFGARLRKMGLQL